MNYIVTALDAEAKALCEHYRLKRSTALPYTLYVNDTTLLLVTGIGKTISAMAVSALLGWRRPHPEDILINVGICGASGEYPIGEALLIHQIIEGDRHYYPDILYPHPLRETPLICVDTPIESPLSFPVDMESAGIFHAASRFFKLHQMAFLKIVSDHYTPQSVTKEGVISLMQSHRKTLDALIASLQNSVQNTPLFTPEETILMDEWKSHFTVSQGGKLEEALCYFRLKYPEKTLLFPSDPIPLSKRERSALLESFIATLTA